MCKYVHWTIEMQVHKKFILLEKIISKIQIDRTMSIEWRKSTLHNRWECKRYSEMHNLLQNYNIELKERNVWHGLQYETNTSENKLGYTIRKSKQWRLYIYCNEWWNAFEGRGTHVILFSYKFMDLYVIVSEKKYNQAILSARIMSGQNKFSTSNSWGNHNRLPVSLFSMIESTNFDYAQHNA